MSSGKKRQWKVSERLTQPSIWECLGPGLITGAADDDPSGIATYSQAGAKFGLATLWTLWLTYPLMVAMQFASALIGRVTGKGLASNLKKHYPAPLVYALVASLFVANTINLGADIGAMGEAVALVIGGPALVYAVLSALLALALLVLLRFRTYANILKYLTVSLFAYIGVLLFVHIEWADVARALVMPHAKWNSDYLTAIVAIFGTTISPYLFFWQASHEVEEQRETPKEKPLHQAPAQAPVQLRRVKLDTLMGMGISNIVAFCIMLTAGAVLFPRGLSHIESAAQAAEALRPIAGKFSFFLFAVGIFGTGMLAIPTLAGSVAYAVAETFKWPKGLNKNLFEASGFYGIVALGTALGTAMCFTKINPMDALFWSAVINGVVAVPLMVFIMLIVSSRRIMGEFRASLRLRIAGWTATAVMLAAAVAMFATWKLRAQAMPAAEHASEHPKTIARAGSRVVIYVALAANILIAIGKFIAASLSGSSAMWSEGVHSLVDSVNEVLLLYGIHRSGAKPSPSHPLGYGREVYFWSFLVAVLVLAFGAGLSFYGGVIHFRDPKAIEKPFLSMLMLGFAFAFEGTSWLFTLREFRAHKGKTSYFDAFRRSKDPTVFTVLLEDTAALIGLLIAFAGLILALVFEEPRFDAAASIAIGLLLTATSMFLARETKSLLIGEAAHGHVRDCILKIAADDPGIRKINGLITMQMGPDQVMAAMSAEFEDALTTPQIENCIKRIEAKVKDLREEVTTLFVKPQTPETFEDNLDDWLRD